MAKKAQKPARFPIELAPMYAMLYIGNAAYQNNTSNFLREASLSEQAIGSILALVPLAGMAGQLLFGAAGDRMRLKRTLLVLLSLLSGAAMLALGLSSAVWQLAATLSLYAFFQMSIEPILNTITLETLDKSGAAFGPVRMVGTIAFALASPIIGWIVRDEYARSPFIGAVVLTLSAAAALFLPKVQGHARKGNKAPLRAILSQRPLLLLVGFVFILMMALSFFYVYFPMLFTSPEVGGSSTLLGICYLIGALVEIPFLLLSDRWIERIGAGKMLLLSAAAMALRWLLIFLFPNKYALLATQMLHSLSYIVVTFVMAKYINLVVPLELKATGQALFTLIGLTASRALGSLLGGAVAGALGIRAVFLVGCLMVTAAGIVFLLFMRKEADLANAGKASG